MTLPECILWWYALRLLQEDPDTTADLAYFAWLWEFDLNAQIDRMRYPHRYRRR